MRIHDVFHVGVLKPFHGEPPLATPALPPLQHRPPGVQRRRLGLVAPAAQTDTVLGAERLGQARTTLHRAVPGPGMRQ
jgi:hypothetical protein